MHSTIRSLLLALALLAVVPACGSSKGPSCDKVVEHTLSLMPAEFKAQMGDRKEMVNQCEQKTSKAERECAMKAEKLEDLMACSKEKKGS